jgi:hypothetical protein
VMLSGELDRRLRPGTAVTVAKRTVRRWMSSFMIWGLLVLGTGPFLEGCQSLTEVVMKMEEMKGYLFERN